MEEIWKKVNGYEETYLVSNLGRVKSIDRVGTMGFKGRTRKLQGRILSLNKTNGNGYLIVALCDLDGQKNNYIHRLVAEAFVTNPENKNVVNHIDANRSNNKAENLEWVTTKENIHHVIKLGRKTDYSINSPNCTLTEDNIISILILLNTTNESHINIGLRFNVGKTTIMRISKGITHKKIVEKFHNGEYIMTTNQIIQQIKDMEDRIKFYKAEIKLLGGI